MIFAETAVAGALLIRPERLEDERGFFARTYCTRELQEHGVDPQVVQRSISYNRLRGTLRGMHFQVAPHQENKFVTCVRGSVHDVIVDLRPESPTFRAWFATALTDVGFETLFVPKGCAHGFITLSDDAVVQYDISEPYHPDAARGIRYDDPTFGIRWPMEPILINARDLGFSPYTPTYR